MGRYLFRMPDVGEGVAEAEIIAWHVKPGDSVAEDQSLVDVMTDKATVDMTAPVSGTVVALHGEIGELRAVGSTLVELEVEGEGNAAAAADAPIAATAEEKAAPVVEAAPKPAIASPSTPARPVQPSSDRPAFATRTPGQEPLAAPATRRRAHERGIALQYVPGTGPGGRITPDDLDRYVETGGAVAAAGPGHLTPRTGGSDIRIVGMRRKIAEKMQEAKRRIPHITYVEECDLTELEALRADLNANRAEGQPKLTLLPFFIRAMVRVLPRFPQLNARYDDDEGVLHQSEAIHLGIATQTPAGLLVPVIRHAEALDVWGCAAELSRLSKAARDGSATREEMSGATITVTSLGTLGGISSTPIVNHPEVAMIGPNKLIERPTVQGGFVTVRKMMNLSSSFDHRIVDGYDAALFVQQLKRMLEHPALIFMD